MSSHDELQNELDRIMREQNSRGLEEFEWYSPLEMQTILYSPLSPSCPVQLKKMEEADYRQIPLLNQVRYLLDHIHQRGEVKLTAKGFLPTDLVNDLYHQGFMKEYLLDTYSKDKKLREFDSFPILMTRLLVEVAGLTKKRKGKLSLTKKGESIHSKPHELLSQFLEAISYTFNWAYFDVFGQNNIGRLGWAFSVILLSKYGQQERTSTFYAEKHFNAFPGMMEEVQEPSIRDQQTTAYHCYFYRTFDHFLQHIGVVNVKFEQYFDETRSITATDLLWIMFSVDTPNMAKGRN